VGAPTAGYAPFTVSFTDQSDGAVQSWLWDFGDGETSTQQNPQHTYQAADTYTVTLTATGPGGSDTAVRSNYITVSPQPDPPVADFTPAPLTGEAPLDVTFTDLSQGEIDTWTWSFGDGQGSNAQNPTHTYQTSGDYTVTLTVTGPGGTNVKTVVDCITVTTPPAPVAAFTADPPEGTAPLPVLFTDESTGAITDWLWDFGDGTPTSSEQNPSHTYTAAGTHHVTLTVTGPGGSSDAFADILVAEPPPVADFVADVTTGAAPLTVQFTDLSTGSVTSWSWNFGDGQVSVEANPAHNYTAPGTYTISLTVDGDGGSDTETKAGYITVTDGQPTEYTVYVSDLLVTIGSVTGDIAATRANDGTVQTIEEGASGRAGASSLHAEYILHTTVDPASVTGLVLDFDLEWIGGDASADPIVISIWQANGGSGTWIDITSAALGGTYVASTPGAHIDPQGDIRILLEDTSATKKEKKESAIVDLLVATLMAGPPDTTPPSPPTGLDATASNLAALLAWDANTESDLAGYRVYRSSTSGSGYVQVSPGLIGDPSYADPVGAEGTYFYVVTAVDGSDNESGRSNEAEVTLELSGQTVHVQGIAMGSNKAGKNWKATAVVLVHDQAWTPQAGATVVGDWYFDDVLIQTSVSAVTDASGNASFTSPPEKTSGGTFTFAVIDVLLTGYTYNPAENAINPPEGSIDVP
jgi:PKD repeat protein